MSKEDNKNTGASFANLNRSNKAFNSVAVGSSSTITPANDHKKVVLFTGDNGTCHAALNTLIPDLQRAGIEPIVLLTSGTNSPKAKIPEIKEFSFFETGLPNAIYDHLENSDIVLDDEGRPKKDMHYSPNQLADLYNVQVEKIDDVNDPELIASINADPSIIGSVSIKNYKIFCEPAIEGLKSEGKFLWNVHTGELPNYRGVFIPVRVMQDGNSEYGWTLHDIDPGIDTGPVVDIRTRFLEDDETALDAYYNMAEKGANMIVDNIKLAAKGMPRSPLPQDESNARYFSFPTAEEIQELADRDPPKNLLNEDTAVERYLEMFSDQSTHPAHAQNLRILIESAIYDFRNERPIRQRPDLYTRADAAGNDLAYDT